MKSSKILSFFVVLLGVVSFILYYFIAKNGDEADTQINILLNITTFLLYATAILAILGLVIDVVSSKKSLKYTLTALAGFVVVILIAMSMASNQPYELGGNVYSASVSKWSDTGLWTFYLLAIIALVLMFFSWIADFFKD